jgi:hypothetical protein
MVESVELANGRGDIASIIAKSRFLGRLRVALPKECFPLVEVGQGVRTMLFHRGSSRLARCQMDPVRSSLRCGLKLNVSD